MSTLPLVGATFSGAAFAAFVENDGCAFYYYMSLDYLPGEWRVVRSDRAPDQLTPAAARGGTTPAP